MAVSGPTALLGEAHWWALELLARASGRHPQGLHQDARDLDHRRGRSTRHRLCVVGDAAAVLRHITSRSVDDLVATLELELSIPLRDGAQTRSAGGDGAAVAGFIGSMSGSSSAAERFDDTHVNEEPLRRHRGLILGAGGAPGSWTDAPFTQPCEVFKL